MTPDPISSSILVTLGIIFCLDMSLALAQVKAPINQQAGDCALNLVAGSGNSVSLVCNNVDPKVAEQVQAILNSTQRNEKATKDLHHKLDLLLKQILKPPRRIPADKRAEIVATLARTPAKITVPAIQQNAEAYQFAQDWYDVFKAAGWTMMDDMVRVFLCVPDCRKTGKRYTRSSSWANCHTRRIGFCPTRQPCWSSSRKS